MSKNIPGNKWTKNNDCALLLQISMYAVSEIKMISCYIREMTYYAYKFLDMSYIGITHRHEPCQ